MRRAAAVALLLALSLTTFAADGPEVREIAGTGITLKTPAGWTFDVSKTGGVARSPGANAVFALSLLNMSTPPPNAAPLLLEQILLGVKAKLEDFQIETPVRATTIAGRHAAEVTTNYLFPRGETTVRLHSRMVLVPREGGIVMINMTNQPESDEATVRELAGILESLTIGK